MSTQTHFPLLRLVLSAQDEPSRFTWFGFDAVRKLLAQGEAPLTALPAHDELEVVLPARRISAHHLTLPAQAGKHLDALISHALEDRVLGDKADILSIPGAQSGTQRQVWVCSCQWFEGQLARLSAAGLRVDRAFPEYELLANPAGANANAPTPDGFVFRTSDGRTGLVGTESLIPALTGAPDWRLVAELYHQPRPAGGVDMLAGRVSQHPSKAFDPRSLRRPGLLLVLIGALLLFSQIVHWRQLESRELRLQHEIRQTFATRFPGTPIVDPVLQWESKRREQSARSNGDALDAVLTIATKINAPIRPRSIEARDGQLRMTLTDTEVAQFKAQLDNAGKPESSPAETGFTRLQYRLAR